MPAIDMQCSFLVWLLATSMYQCSFANFIGDAFVIKHTQKTRIAYKLHQTKAHDSFSAIQGLNAYTYTHTHTHTTQIHMHTHIYIYSTNQPNADASWFFLYFGKS